MNTLARIATVTQGGFKKGSIQADREYVMGLLDRALLSQPDLVCLPEAFATVGAGGTLADRCEPVDGPTVAAAAKLVSWPSHDEVYSCRWTATGHGPPAGAKPDGSRIP